MTKKGRLSCLMLIVLVSGCGVVDEAAPEEAWSDGKGDAKGDAETSSRLAKQYGAAPKRYLFAFDGSNNARRRLMAALPQAAAFVNNTLAQRGYAWRVTEAELATNLLAEGAIYAMQNGDAPENNNFAWLSSYWVLGLDSLLPNFKQLRPWLHPSVIDIVESPATKWSTINGGNEGGDSSPDTLLPLVQGLYANAAMFVWARTLLQRDLAAPDPARVPCCRWAQADRLTACGALVSTDINTLSRAQQFFWTTVYFNAGPGTGQCLLYSMGLGLATTPWNGIDDWHASSSSPHYNAAWRTATYELLETAIGGRQLVVPPDEACQTQLDEDGDGRVSCADEDCKAVPPCFSGPELCRDGLDNDGNGQADCDDPYCGFLCQPPGWQPETGSCFDNVDNNGDGLLDCADPSCSGDCGLT